jgi:hypothetical protein
MRVMIQHVMLDRWRPKEVKEVVVSVIGNLDVSMMLSGIACPSTWLV